MTETNENSNEVHHSDFLALSPSYPAISAFGAVIGWVIITVVLFLVNWLVEKIQIPLAVFIVLPAISIFSGIYAFYAAKACGYRVGQFDLHYKEGLWWKKQTALSFSRIQHIDISHGPLERKYAMATIKFYTAGGSSSDLKIPGLPNITAEEMRANILRFAQTEFEQGNE